MNNIYKIFYCWYYIFNKKV